MAIRIYSAILILSVIIGVVLLGVIPDQFEVKTLMIVSLLPLLLFTIGLVGLIAHLVKPRLKGNMIGYVFILSSVVIFLIFVHVYVVLPLVHPEFSYQTLID